MTTIPETPMISLAQSEAATVIADEHTGLTAAQVAASRAAHGRNEIPQTSSRSVWAILRTHVFTLFNGIVLASFAVLAVLGRWQDALFGFSAIANSIIGIWQEYSAKRQLDNLRVLHAPHARARRDGVVVELAREDLVCGDIIALRSGDQIPADASVLTSNGLQIDESLLTGEEDAVDKQRGDELFSGAIVVAGSGTARVTRVGASSFAAKLTAEAKQFSLVNSEVREGMKRVLRIVAWLLLPVLLISINGQVQAFGGWEAAIASQSWRDAAVGAVAAAIAMVPLGMLLMTSVAFAVGALKLGRKNVLVQELHAVEGLARVDVLCFDKTGTLTEGGVVFDRAHPVAHPQAGWATALATIAAADDANDTAASLSTEFSAELAAPAERGIPFTSQRKWSAVSIAEERARGTWILGAPDIILRPGIDGELLALVGELSHAGKRVVALCHSPKLLPEAAVSALILPEDRRGVAVLALRERVREDAADTVRYFREEGVSLRVISGDDPRTVAAVARSVGLIGEAERGVDARTLPDEQEQLAEIMERERVFGRVTPTQKRQMVHALQSRGHVVAMTGDGVNDVLALKDADLGISMGTGSGASRAVSRITLLDNQFQAMPSIVLEGRQAIANIERLSKLYLTKTAWAVFIALLFGLLCWPYPLEPRQMAILDGISIGWPAFVLALIPNTRRYLHGYLRRTLRFALPAGVVICAGLIVIKFVGEHFNQSLEQQETASALVLAVTSLWVLGLVCRPFGWLLGSVLVGSVTVLILVLLVPVTVWFFGFAWPDGPVLLGCAVLIVLGCVALEVHGQLRIRAESRELG